MQGKIFIADDEENIRHLLESFLTEAGYEVTLFSNGEALYEAFLENEPDLLILDVMMPGIDGFSLSSKIRKVSDIPILLLTARDTEADYVTGFTFGCDDYFTKPFSPLKLTMRVNAMMKRILKEKPDEKDTYSYLDISLDVKLKKCLINNVEVKLTNTEFAVVCYFLENQDRAISRDELLENIWGYDAMVETRVTDDLIKRLRKKLSDVNAKTQIETVWGFGFKLSERVEK